MLKTSAGLLMYKLENNKLKVFLIHPGGPFWEHKDKGVWGIPKGERDDDKDVLLDVAKREFQEETGIKISNDVKFLELGNIKQKNNKIVHAWGFENNWSGKINCQSFVERFYNDKKIRFPEADDGKFFEINEAKEKILDRQWELVERLIKELNININEKKKIKQTKLF